MKQQPKWNVCVSVKTDFKHFKSFYIWNVNKSCCVISNFKFENHLVNVEIFQVENFWKTWIFKFSKYSFSFVCWLNLFRLLTKSVFLSNSSLQMFKFVHFDIFIQVFQFFFNFFMFFSLLNVIEILQHLV